MAQERKLHRAPFYNPRLVHGQFALLAFFMDPKEDEQDDRDFLREHLHIEGLDSVLVRAEGARVELGKARERPTGSGTPKARWELLGRLRADAASIPTRMERKVPVGLGKNSTIENIFLFPPE